MKVDFYSTTSMPTSLKNDFTKIFRKTLDSDSLIEGKSCRNFEEAFSHYLSMPFVLGVGNGFDAIKIALQALGVKSGDRVAVPAHTFVATWFAVMSVGAVPIGIDVTPNGQIDIDILEKVESLKAVIPVHMHGTHCDMLRLTNWARKNKILVVEDCAQAAGLKIQGKMAGSWGDAAAFSFYPTKNLFALGDGGVVAFKDAEYFELARSISRYGTQNASKYHHIRVGQNSRLDSLQAAFLLHSLPMLDEWNQARKLIATYYQNSLTTEVLDRPDSANHVYHHFIIKHQNRNLIKKMLETCGVGTEIHYPIPAAAQVGVGDGGVYINAQALSDTCLSLPISPWQSASETEYVVNQMLRMINV
jgi:dTDP-4-amino-4,6-dideoxygalactose transaminase